MSTEPVVLIYIDGDQYGGEPVCFAGTGVPSVFIFDGARYDKYNWDDGNDSPRETYEEDLKNLEGHDAHAVLLEWVEQACEQVGIDDDDDEEDDD